MNLIKVASTSRPYKVAGAIAGVFRELKMAEIQAIGAGAINQAVKAIIVARHYLARDGYKIGVIPYFVDIELQGSIRTAVRFRIFPISALPDHVEHPPTNLPSSRPTGSDDASQDVQDASEG